jgi:PAS domain-containing protein
MAMTDITRRKETEQALRAAEALREVWAYYRQLAESLPQSITADAHGTISVPSG